MNKRLIATYKKPITATLLVFAILGGLAALLAVAWPFLSLAALKFIDGAPDKPSLVDDFIKVLLMLTPVVPYFLFLGGISSIIYTFIESESKLFLRVWGTTLLLLFAIFVYQYVH